MPMSHRKSRRKEKILPDAKAITLWCFVGFVLIVLLIACRFYMQKLYSQERQYANLAISIERIEQALYQMEGANNGFLLTGNDAFRANFIFSRDVLSDNYQEIANLARDNPVQIAHIKKFKTKLTEWFALYNPLIIARRKASQESERQPVVINFEKQKASLNKTKTLFDEMLALLHEVRSEQNYKNSALENADGTWFFQGFVGQGDSSSSVPATTDLDASP